MASAVARAEPTTTFGGVVVPDAVQAHPHELKLAADHKADTGSP